jgi:hypothetical protein
MCLARQCTSTAISFGVWPDLTDRGRCRALRNAPPEVPTIIMALRGDLTPH